MKFFSRPKRFHWAVAFLCLWPVAGCSTGGPGEPAPPSPEPIERPPEAEVADTAVAPPAEARETVPDTACPPSPFQSWADSVLSTLTLEEKAGQLLMPYVLGDFAPDGSASSERVRKMVEDLGVGGLIVSVGSPSEVAVKLNDLQSRARLPLLITADLERGAGFRFRGVSYLPGPIPLGGATEFPSLMAVGATHDEGLAYEMGRVTGVEAGALGIRMPFAPVLDVNNNPGNPIINVRSFGEDPHEVARLGTAFLRGAQEAGVLATGKHFPGHGDTETDSHLDVPVITVSRERLDTVELLPFRAAIQAGIGGIMTAHIAVPALTGANGTPATLSHEVLTGLLRDDLHFQGLIFTDAMDMYAIDRRHSRREAAVLAVEAGADVILMPPDPEAARDGIAEAVRTGRLAEARLDASVLRILKVKERLGLNEEREVPVKEVLARVGTPEHEAVAQEIADRSITLLKNDRNLLSLLGTRSARVLSVTYRGPTDLLAGRVLNSGLRAKYPRLATAEVDRNTPKRVYDGLLRSAAASNLVIVSLYVTTVSYSGSVAISDEAVDFLRALADQGVPHVVISFGNPYLVTDFPEVQAYLLAWSGTDVSQRAAVRALFGEIPITGRSPIRIPPEFEIGDGIPLPVRGGRRDF